jgi:dihydropyrimidinase
MKLMNNVLIKGGLLVDHQSVSPQDLLIQEGRIAHKGYDIDLPLGTALFNASGLVIMPGFIDIHTHFSLQVGKYTSSDNFASGTLSALAGGTTTIIDYITPGREEDPREAIKRWFHNSRTAHTDYGFHLSIPSFNADTFNVMTEAAGLGISGFKVFQAYPDRLMLSDEEIGLIMQHARKLGGVVFVHSESGELISSLQKEALAEGHNHAAWHEKTRPAYGEGESAARILELVEKTRCPTVIVHIGTKDVIEVLKQAKKKKLPLFGETCPQYLWLHKKFLERKQNEGNLYVCSPPLRELEHLKAMWDSLVNGDLHLVSTDHCPFTREEKTKDIKNFAEIPNGLPGVETRPILLHNGAIAGGRFGWKKLTRLLSTAPAILSGLYPQKGSLQIGADADLAIFNPDMVTSLSAKDLHSNCDYSPYEGMLLKGGIEFVFSRGRLVRHGDQFETNPGQGNYLARKEIKAGDLNLIRMEDYPWVFS